MARYKTHEYDEKGRRYNTTASFRQYDGWSDATSDYWNLIHSSPVYGGYASAPDVDTAIDELHKSPYATDPKQADTLRRMMKQGLTPEQQAFIDARIAESREYGVPDHLAQVGAYHAALESNWGAAASPYGIKGSSAARSKSPATGLKPYDLQPPMSPNAPPADSPTPADLADYWESQKLAGTVKQGRAMANGGTVTERTAVRWEEKLKFDASKFNPQFRDNLATLQSNLTDYTLAPSHPSAGFRDRATYKGNGAKGSAHFDGLALDITYPYGKVGELAELARNSGISEMAVYAPAGTAADQNVTVHLGGRDTGGKFLARQGVGSSKWVEPPKDHALYAYNGLPVVNGPAAPSITNNDHNAPRFAQFASPEQPKSAPTRGPSTMPSSPRGLGPMVADNYQPTSPISKALGMDLDQGFLARGLDKMVSGSGKSQRTPVSTRGFNDQAGPIPASQRPTQRATPTNSHGYRSPSAAGFAGGMLAQALSSLGDDGGSRVPDMPMDTTDYQSSFAASNDQISNNLSTLTQERWRRMIEEMS
jgi:hypothetical protein